MKTRTLFSVLLLGAWFLATGPARAADAPSEAKVDQYGDPLPEGAVARFGSSRLVHRSAVRLQFSPGGRFLASWASSYSGPASNHGLRIWDRKTGRLLLHRLADQDFAFTPNGLLLYEERQSRQQLHLIDLPTGKLRRILDQEGRTILAVAVTPDGRTASASWRERGTFVYNLAAAGGVKRRLVGPDHLARHPGRSPGRASRVKPRRVCPDELAGLCLSADGRRLAGFSDREVRVYDVQTAQRVQTIALAGERTPSREALAMSADGSRVAVAQRGRAHVYRTATGKMPEGFEAPEGDFVTLRFSADNRVLTGLTRLGAVVLWSAESGNEERCDKTERDLATEPAPALADDGVTVAGLEYKTGRILLWNARTDQNLFQRDASPVSVRFVRPDLVAADDGEGKGICLWSAKNGALQRRLPPGVLSRDGKYLAKGPVISEVDGGKVVCRLPTAEGIVLFTPDDKSVVTGPAKGEGTFDLWEVATGRRRASIPYLEWGLRGAAFSPDGRTLFVCTGGRSLCLEVSTAKVREELTGPDCPEAHKHDDYRHQFQFSRDGRTLLVVRTRDLYVMSRKPRGPVFQLLIEYMAKSALSPDGRWLATTAGTAVEVRDLHHPRAAIEWHAFRGHEGPVSDLAFSPDGRFLVSASAEGTALVWPMQPVIDRAARPQPAPDDRRLAAWWAALGSDPDRAGQALLAFEEHPARAVAWVAARVSPVKGPAPAQVARWVAELDSENFARRQEAAERLEKLAELAEPALLAALEKRPSAQLTQTAHRLLERLASPETSAERLQALRVVELLERIGSPEACEFLKTLASGAPAAHLTRQSRASLERLTAR